MSPPGRHFIVVWLDYIASFIEQIVCFKQIRAEYILVSLLPTLVLFGELSAVYICKNTLKDISDASQMNIDS